MTGRIATVAAVAALLCGCASTHAPPSPPARDELGWLVGEWRGRRRTFARLEGPPRADGGEWLNVATQGAHRSRVVYERPSATTWRRTQYVSEDSGKTWSVLFVDELRRR